MGTADGRAKVHPVQGYKGSKGGGPLRVLLRVDGAEETRTVGHMEADHGEFVRVLGGNSLDDLDRMLRFEFANIRIVEG